MNLSSRWSFHLDDREAARQSPHAKKREKSHSLEPFWVGIRHDGHALKIGEDVEPGFEWGWFVGRRLNCFDLPDEIPNQFRWRGAPPA